jgi:hypothetical protein
VARDELPESPNPIGMDLRKGVKPLPCLGERGVRIEKHEENFRIAKLVLRLRI